MQYGEGWHCIAILMIFKIQNHQLNAIRLPVFTPLNGIQMFNIYHGVHWGINPLKNTTLSFIPSPSLNQQTV